MGQGEEVTEGTRKEEKSQTWTFLWCVQYLKKGQIALM
jgi:hypothetical protein